MQTVERNYCWWVPEDCHFYLWLQLLLFMALFAHRVLRSFGFILLSPGFDTWFSRTAMEPVHAVSSTWVVGHGDDGRWSRETLFQEESSNSSAMEQKKIMKLSGDISSSLSWVLFSLIYLWSIYIGGDLILEIFQQIWEFTLIRRCLHKSQLPFLPRCLVTSMNEMNPKANVLAFKTTICICY